MSVLPSPAPLPALARKRWSPTFPWKLVRIAVFYLALIRLWELLYRLELWPPYVFPSPVEVKDTLWAKIQDGTIWDATQVTMRRMAISLMSIAVLLISTFCKRRFWNIMPIWDLLLTVMPIEFWVLTTKVDRLTAITFFICGADSCATPNSYRII